MKASEDSSKSLNKNAENGTGDSSMNYILKKEREPFVNQENGSNKTQNTKKLEPEKKRLSDGPVIQTNRFKHDFECLKELGKGGFGKVFKAKNRVDGHIYAVKRIPLKVKECFLFEQDLDESKCEVIQVEGNQVLKEFLREVKSLADLQHKNVVRYHCSWFGSDCSDSASSGSSGSYESPGNDSDETPDSSDSASVIKQKVLLYIQMELCSTNLQKWLEKRNAARVQFDKDHEAIRIFKEMVEGITYIHEMELMHRDLKPANILLTGRHLTVKIGDFGLSKYMWEDIMDQGRVRGACPVPEHTPYCGTLPYAAPEIFQRSDYDCKVDIYSLGIILFEMCSNFGSSESEKIQKVTPLREESKCPDGFKQSNDVAAALIEKLVQKDPEQRPTTAQILNDKLFKPVSDNASLGAGDTKWRTTEENVAWKIVAEKDRENIMLQKTTSVNTGAGDAILVEGLALSGDTANSDSIPIPDMLGLKMKD